MKIKGSVEKIKTIHLISAFVFGVVSCTALRFYHCLSYIDRETGFFVKSDFTVTLFYLILGAVSVFILIGGMLSGTNGQFGEETVHSNIPLGVASLAASCGMFLDVSYCSIQASYSLKATNNSADTAEYFTLLMKNGTLPYRLQSAFAFLSAIFFLVLAFNCFRKKGKITSRRLLALMPVGWACTKMVPFFIKQISFVRVSDLVLEIVAVVFFIVYTLSFAQCVSGIYRDVAQWRLTAVGLVVSLFAIVINMPKLIFTLIGKTEVYVTSDYPISYAELTFAIFALVLIFSMMRQKRTQTEEITEISQND